MINVYSKSDSKLGRLLSNFAHTPFVGGGRTFASVEAWWYWYTTGKKHGELCGLYGFAAKAAGRKYTQVAAVTPAVLKQVYLLKLAAHPDIREMLLASGDEPFDHFYVYDGVKVPATRWLWTAKLWAEVRAEL